MRKVPALTRREMNSFFVSPTGYIVLTIFLFFYGLFFYSSAAISQQASLEDLIEIVHLLCLVATPFLTMRLLSEEYSRGTIETLMTAPVTDAAVVAAKFLATLAFFALMLLPTLAYVVILCILGQPDFGSIVSGYLGLLLMGCNFIALGLFCSALTRNQIVAGVLALVLLLTISVLGYIGRTLGDPFRRVFEYAGSYDQLRPFFAGRIAFRNCFYFLSMTCFWLFLSVRALESRRWR